MYLINQLDLLTQFGTILTLLLSAMSVMKIVKIFMQVSIDGFLLKHRGKRAPADVHRRIRVLDEHLLTREGSRRLSMLVDGGKKKRRLSSRELMKQDQSPGIELTIRNGDNDARVFDNPMKNSNGPSSLARGDVALKTKVDALMKDNIELKKSNIELKNCTIELKKSNIEMTKSTIELKNSNTELQNEIKKLNKQVAMILAGSMPNSNTVARTEPKNKKWKSAKNKLKSVAAFKQRRRSSLMTSSAEVDFVNNVHVDDETGRQYSINPETGISEWLDSEEEAVR